MLRQWRRCDRRLGCCCPTDIGRSALGHSDEAVHLIARDGLLIEQSLCDQVKCSPVALDEFLASGLADTKDLFDLIIDES